MRYRSLVLSGALSALLALMVVAAISRFARSYEWWDALALGFAGACLLAVAVGAIRRFWRGEGPPKPRWFELRANALGLCALLLLTVW